MSDIAAKIVLVFSLIALQSCIAPRGDEYPVALSLIALQFGIDPPGAEYSIGRLSIVDRNSSNITIKSPRRFESGYKIRLRSSQAIPPELLKHIRIAVKIQKIGSPDAQFDRIFLLGDLKKTGVGLSVVEYWHKDSASKDPSTARAYHFYPERHSDYRASAIVLTDLAKSHHLEIEVILRSGLRW